MSKYNFIALIHPIQWTIALPVDATGPAKRQKKTSCIYYRQDRSQSVHSPGGARYFISCLPIDVIASFSFGAKECAEVFLQRYVFEVLQRTLPSFLFLCQLTCQSADIMSSLCGVGVRVNNFSSKTTRPRDVLFFLKDTLSIEDEKLFKACKSVCSSVC